MRLGPEHFGVDQWPPNVPVLCEELRRGGVAHEGIWLKNDFLEVVLPESHERAARRVARAHRNTPRPLRLRLAVDSWNGFVDLGSLDLAEHFRCSVDMALNGQIRERWWVDPSSARPADRVQERFDGDVVIHELRRDVRAPGGPMGRNTVITLFRTDGAPGDVQLRSERPMSDQWQRQEREIERMNGCARLAHWCVVASGCPAVRETVVELLDGGSLGDLRRWLERQGHWTGLLVGEHLGVRLPELADDATLAEALVQAWPLLQLQEASHAA